MHEKIKPGDDLTISAEPGHSSPASRCGASWPDLCERSDFPAASLTRYQPFSSYTLMPDQL